MAHAALVLLIHNLREILHSNDLHRLQFKKEHVESLEEEASFLLSFLHDSQDKGYDREMMKQLDLRIRDSAHKAVDYIDSNVCFRNMPHGCAPEGRIRISMIALQSFTKIIEEMKCFRLKVKEVYENKLPSREIVTGSVQDSSSNSEERLVGVDNDIEALVLRLVEPTPHLEVIPIIGMGGIGKTTLARRIYDDPYIVYHFYVRSWITISQGLTVSVPYQVRAMLLGLLEWFTPMTDEIRSKTNEELGEQLYKKLKGMRYLVVLDDMWHTRAWSSLKMYFPDEGNCSRIVLTSRVADVAVYISPESSPHRMHFLRAAESWELLESKLFGKGSCPSELVRTGKRIAARCQGLPLAVVVVAGLLNNISKTLDNWTKIAESVDSLISKDPKHCIDILAFSYNYLPGFLKACFLYMGAFPRDCDIPASRLTWLWIAEGFINPVAGKSLEDVAEKYLEDLVSRNLVLVGKRRSNGSIKTCYIHDLLNDLCVRESKKERFMRTIKRYEPIHLMEPIHDQRRVSLHASVLHFSYGTSSFPLTRSFLCFDVNKILPDLFLLEFMNQMDFKLLRVLDIMLVRSNHFPIEIVELIHLRYLALAVNCELPGSISKLQKLQTLIIDDILEGQCLPWEIWEMLQLRHVHLKRGCYFPLPSSGNVSRFVLKNLQTLSTLLGPLSCSKKVLACLPHLRKLELFGTESDIERPKCLRNLGGLNELETLKCSFLYRPTYHRLPQSNMFPPNLKRLTLSGSNLPWEDMAKLGMLPNLEVLKLRHRAFDGDTWKPVKDGFPQLKLLLIENSDPMNWDAHSFHFPKLRRLVLLECQRLTEIPQDIGEISTLEAIELHDCNLFVVNSATEVHDQQLTMGNELEIKITWGYYNHPSSDFAADIFPGRKLFH